MAVIVVGGHSRNVGKTSIVAGLIAAMPEVRWTAMKITQYGHGICSADGAACDCATPDHSLAVTEEHSRDGDTDTSRFLVAGAEQVYWVRTRQGYLAEAMPRVRQILASAANSIVESNSLMRFIRPDLYLAALDPGNEDFKDSARHVLDRADALLMHSSAAAVWQNVSLKPVQNRPIFHISADKWVPDDLVDFVRRRLKG